MRNVIEIRLERMKLRNKKFFFDREYVLFYKENVFCIVSEVGKYWREIVYVKWVSFWVFILFYYILVWLYVFCYVYYGIYYLMICVLLMKNLFYGVLLYRWFDVCLGRGREGDEVVGGNYY